MLKFTSRYFVRTYENTLNNKMVISCKSKNLHLSYFLRKAFLLRNIIQSRFNYKSHFTCSNYISKWERTAIMCSLLFVKWTIIKCNEVSFQTFFRYTLALKAAISMYWKILFSISIELYLHDVLPSIDRLSYFLILLF